MSHYDTIFAGGGVAALSLALAMRASLPGEPSMLIVDRDPKDRDDRTLCYWSNTASRFDALAYREWDRLKVAFPGCERVIPLGEYRYRMLRGLDFYRDARAALEASGNVDFRTAEVSEVIDGPEAAQVRLGLETLTANYVFDSRMPETPAPEGRHAAHALRQIFHGRYVETDEPAFDPATPTFMDFRVPQKGEMRFLYVLPLDERRALVEFVSNTPDRAEAILDEYLRFTLGVGAYRVTACEGGASLLSDRLPSRRSGERILRIGAAGGQVKPTSGYAFTRIQNDSAAIVASLQRHGHPFDLPGEAPIYRLCDAVMLRVMRTHGEGMRAIFADLFARNPLRRILRLLDQQASPAEVILLAASLSRPVFLRALLEVRLERMRRNFRTDIPAGGTPLRNAKPGDM